MLNLEGQVSKRRRFTLGADPELFVFEGVKLLPAYEFLPPKGKDTPIYWDGYQAEWKYNQGEIRCLNNLVKYTRERLQELLALAKEKSPKARLSLVNVVRVPQAILDTADPMHVELGCQPSFNAYNLMGKAVYNPRHLPYRFAGGHLHFGTWETQKPSYVNIVKMLDSILGVWSVGVAANVDNPIRRQYYGLAGEFRKPKYTIEVQVPGSVASEGYGVEYRVLSNWWLASPATLQVTWDIGRMAVRLAVSRYGKLWASNEQETIETINTCDYQQARKIIKRNEPMFKWILGQVYRKPESIQRALDMCYRGVQTEVKDVHNIPENWHFTDEWIYDARQPWARWEW